MAFRPCPMAFLLKLPVGCAAESQAPVMLTRRSAELGADLGKRCARRSLLPWPRRRRMADSPWRQRLLCPDVSRQGSTDRASAVEAQTQPSVAQDDTADPSQHTVPDQQPHASPIAEPSAADKKKLWLAAIKPPMYSVGIIPVLVAGAAVFSQLGQVAGLRCLGFVLASVFVIAWLNLSNDAFDASTGVDKTKRESIVNLTGNRSLILVLANLFLAAGVSLLALLISSTGDSRPALMLAFSIACGYVYQGPPFRLSYKGLGEPLCFFAFGPSATSAFYLALLPAASAAAAPAALTPLLLLAAVCVGTTTTIILFCSHFHQIAGDTAAGKMSPLVRLGTERAVSVLKAATALPYISIAAASVAQLSGLVPALGVPYTLLPATLLSLPSALSMISFAEANHRVPSSIAPLKIFATKLHMAFGMALVAGLVTGRLFF